MSCLADLQDTLRAHAVLRFQLTVYQAEMEADMAPP